MEIRFKNIGPRIIPASLDMIRSEKIASRQPMVFTPAPLALMHPLVCMSMKSLTQVTAVEVKGLEKDIRTTDLVRVDQLGALFNEGRIGFGYNRDTNEDFLIWDHAFDHYGKEIYAYESMSAIKQIESGIKSSSDLSQKKARDIFLHIESIVTKNSSPKNLRHLSFMLKEAAGIDGDYINASAILLHNYAQKDMDQILTIGRKKNNVYEQIVDEIKDTVRRFNNLNNTPYLPPAKNHEYQIQDSMNALVKISGGNGRAMQVLFVHKLSSIMMQPEDANDITGRAVRELYAPLAERFGKKEMASKLRNQALRLHDSKNYILHETKIVSALSMSRKEAEDFIERVKIKLKEILSAENCGCYHTSGRVKTPWGAHSKSEYKSELYPEIFLMTDLLAVTGVTTTPITLEQAMEFIKTALGEDFSNFIYDKDDKELETKSYPVEGKIYLVHHIGVILKDGNSLEAQFMDREAYQMLDYGARAHWVYKLEKLTRQKFDHKLLQICAKKMTGNLLRDVKMTYDILSQWVYVFTPESGMVRPIRVNAKAIPVDAASYVFNEKIDQYAGVRIGKVWAPGQLRDAGEFNPLEDGDYLVFKRTGSGYIDRIGRKAMIAASQHQETKALLYPDDRDEPAPKSSRGKKNLRRK